MTPTVRIERYWVGWLWEIRRDRPEPWIISEGVNGWSLTRRGAQSAVGRVSGNWTAPAPHPGT